MVQSSVRFFFLNDSESWFSFEAALILNSFLYNNVQCSDSKKYFLHHKQMMTTDSCFLETYGFPLGQRTRQGELIKIPWNKPKVGEFFRTTVSYNSQPTGSFDEEKGTVHGALARTGWFVPKFIFD